jgi:protein arginine N-methyltransferase 7
LLRITAHHDASQLSLSAHKAASCTDGADHAAIWMEHAWNGPDFLGDGCDRAVSSASTWHHATTVNAPAGRAELPM